MFPATHQNYYDRIQSVDIVQVVDDLLKDRITAKSATRITLRCPIHRGKHGRSFVVTPARNAWYCFKCSQGGGPLQLAEAAMTGAVTYGMRGGMSPGHQKARDYLAYQVGLPPLGQIKGSPEEIEKWQEVQMLKERAQLTLRSLVQSWHFELLESEKAQGWLHDLYGFGKEVIEAHFIGYATPKDWCRSLQDSGFTRKEILATGAFVKPKGAGHAPLIFEHHLVFPTFCYGQVVNVHGRKTPDTPEADWNQGKWKRLHAHDPEKRTHVVPGIGRGWVFGEDQLCGVRKENVVMVEGVPDAIAWMQHGYSALAMGALTLSKVDKERLAPKLARVKSVVVVPDREPDPKGQKKAVELCLWLKSRGVKAKVGQLPLPHFGKTNVPDERLEGSDAEG